MSAGQRLAETDRGELAVARRQPCADDALDELLGAPPQRDHVGDGDEREAVALGVGARARDRARRAVLVHHERHRGRGHAARRAGEVDGRLGSARRGAARRRGARGAGRRSRPAGSRRRRRPGRPRPPGSCGPGRRPTRRCSSRRPCRRGARSPPSAASGSPRSTSGVSASSPQRSSVRQRRTRPCACFERNPTRRGVANCAASMRLPSASGVARLGEHDEAAVGKRSGGGAGRLDVDVVAHSGITGRRSDGRMLAARGGSCASSPARADVPRVVHRRDARRRARVAAVVERRDAQPDPVAAPEEVRGRRERDRVLDDLARRARAPRGGAGGTAPTASTAPGRARGATP